MSARTERLSRVEIASHIRESVGWLRHPTRLGKHDARRASFGQCVDQVGAPCLGVDSGPWRNHHSQRARPGVHGSNRPQLNDMNVHNGQIG